MPTHANQTQAQVTMAHTVFHSQFIKDEQFDRVNYILTGHNAEGGALWRYALKLFPGCMWSDEYLHIQFEDNSRILFIRAPDSMFNTTYKAVLS